MFGSSSRALRTGQVPDLYSRSWAHCFERLQTRRRTSKVFLIAYGVEDAQQLAARNATYCSPIALEDSETVPFILPEEISRYMTGGVYCPMDGIEDGGAVWAEEW